MENEDNSSPLVVEKSEVVLVKPSKPTPDVSLSLSTIDNNPYIEAILKTIWVFAPKPYLKDQPSHDPASLLQYALSNALVHYYPLAGKLHRKSDDNRLQLNCKAGDGACFLVVPFIRATARCTLSSLSYMDNADHLAGAYQLVPCYEPVKGCEGYDPLALQVTKFACGGITIGMSHSHSVCDGVGVAQFFRTMIELASGKTQPTVISVWQRERLTFNNINAELGDFNQNPEVVDLPKAFTSIATSPYTLTEDMVREILDITSEDITKLKKLVGEDEQMTNDKEKMVVTTLEILAAHVWRARCRALKLNPEGTTVLGLAIGIRSIMEPALPEGYYGNAFVNAYVSLTASELSESSLSHIVRLIKNMKTAAIRKQYVLGELSKIEGTLKMKASFEGINAGSMMLSDWRQIGLHYNGWGGLVNIIPLFSVKLPHLCAFLPASKAVPGMQGGVRVLVTLPKAAMAKFKEEMNVS
ncbi:PREDICTED: spermidine coumaroyl-CoA acyltransferase-like [Camelina sativa]|uniref:Spermidine coumaroyl-CoA acyltransferase-like n=1 Tax=Camelina sativa TaxID=90675 RepID=A0ABM0YX81_CAMSA|nr:PREDICTED: spermidine coumaroyl-CoA acyltransferase-like [Camelina sativa]